MEVPTCVEGEQAGPEQRWIWYCVTPTLSVDAVHARLICEPETFAVNEDGADGAVPSVTVTLALSDFDGSAWETALTVTVAGLGGAAGGVYKPEALIVPVAAAPPAIEFTCQVTAVFAVPETVAVNCCVCPVLTLIVLGETTTVTPCTWLEELLQPANCAIPAKPKNRKTAMRARTAG